MNNPSLRRWKPVQCFGTGLVGIAASAGFGQWESHFFFGFFFDPTCSNEVKVCIATQREREKIELVGTVNTKREKYITLVFGRERKKRERERERESLYSLKT